MNSTPLPPLSLASQATTPDNRLLPLKILAVKIRALGDTVLLTASLSELRRHYPSAEIHVLVDQRFAEIVQGVAGVSTVWRYQTGLSWVQRVLQNRRFGQALAAERFDVALNFHASLSSARLVRRSGAAVKAVHFHDFHQRDRFSTHKIPDQWVLKPAIQRDLDTLRALGLECGLQVMPGLELQEHERAWAREKVGGIGTSLPSSCFSSTVPSSLLGLAPGASRTTKAWPPERFAALADAWWRMSRESEKRPGKEPARVVVLLGSPAEKNLLTAVVAEVRRLQKQNVGDERAEAEADLPWLQVCCDLSVRELMAVCSQLSLLVANDSGPKHVAVGLGIPTLTLFGPEDPFEWHPYPQQEHPYFYKKNLACRNQGLFPEYPWCGIERCEVEKHRCMTDITVAEVVAKMTEHFDQQQSAGHGGGHGNGKPRASGSGVVGEGSWRRRERFAGQEASPPRPAFLVSGFSLIRHGVSFDYPFLESLRSLLPWVDELVVNVGEGQDETLAQVARFCEQEGAGKARFFVSSWQLEDEAKQRGGKILAEQTNLALAQCRGDWCVYLQADEVLHEDDGPLLRQALLQAHGRPEVEGLLFDYRHFYGAYNVIQVSRSVYRKEVRAVRKSAGPQSVGDAQSFRGQGGRKLAVLPAGGARIFHYGWARHPEAMRQKTFFMDQLYHGKPSLENQAAGLPHTGHNYRYKKFWGLRQFSGSHPAVMAARVAHPTWTWDLRASPWTFGLRDVRKIVLGLLEQLSGRRWFEYRSYRLLPPQHLASLASSSAASKTERGQRS